MGRDDDIAAILNSGRQNRRRAPRGLWVAALIVGAVCAAGFAIAMLAPADRTMHLPERREVERGPGLGFGLVIGAAAGIAIGVFAGISLERQRSHSSRRSP
jgi:hypothetical protein